jgi:hypothetical protein
MKTLALKGTSGVLRIRVVLIVDEVIILALNENLENYAYYAAF